ncbi:MAG: PfkB family carbohydrate kinase [Mobiluncus porci]|uniref:PfkB family carbohydrate kinase n=1 Tax=Mobiluncus porci TaxID=2652278 RepID=UPI0023EFB2E6|nr:PfkB family carbohydrate kinase [Mobiluncus porci]MDD7541903.1 PfkB family carbohydrate kinase [Mobiluncus porci]MDY5749373.1 PfkB family carbohydrate kinase [Mobiluncus porci]
MKNARKNETATWSREEFTKALTLYAVTDRRWLDGRSLLGDVSAAINGGASFIQLREKTLEHDDFYREAVEIQALCHSRRVPFVVNDNVEIALEMNADGVHVGQEDMEAGHVVTDPVMVSTSGSKLISDDAISVLKAELFGLSELITPNLPEGEALVERPIQTSDDMIAAAKEISETYHTAVLLKGGHHLNDANDLLLAGGDYRWLEGERIDTNNTHGTGCALSSAIAANLAKGFDLGQSIECAKDFITGTLVYGLDLGAGSGPMNHAFDLRGRFAEGMN